MSITTYHDEDDGTVWDIDVPCTIIDEYSKSFTTATIEDMIFYDSEELDVFDTGDDYYDDYDDYYDYWYEEDRR